MEWVRDPELRLSNVDWDGHLTDEGDATFVRRAVLCPCIHPETRRPRPGHAACGGWGYQYPSSLEIPDLPVQWVGNSLKWVQKEAGTVEPGDYTCTWPSTQRLGVGDLFVHPYEEAMTDDAYVRGHVDPLGESMERIRFRFPRGVEDLRDLARVYRLDVDFEIAPDGRIVWKQGGLRPADGALYTVRYRYLAEYMISNPPTNRHDGARQLPWKTRVTRWDPLAVQKDQDLGEVET